VTSRCGERSIHPISGGISTIRELLVTTNAFSHFSHSKLSFHTPCNQPRVELAWRMDEEPDELMRD
jgi:hypothetical protein